jgi:hypothetical protein
VDFTVDLYLLSCPLGSDPDFTTTACYRRSKPDFGGLPKFPCSVGFPIICLHHRLCSASSFHNSYPRSFRCIQPIDPNKRINQELCCFFDLPGLPTYVPTLGLFFLLAQGSSPKPQSFQRHFPISTATINEFYSPDSLLPIQSYNYPKNPSTTISCYNQRNPAGLFTHPEALACSCSQPELRQSETNNIEPEQLLGPHIVACQSFED